MKVKTRRRKLPVTISLSNGKPSSNPTFSGGSANPRASARVIRRFHVLLKRKTQLERVLKAEASKTKTRTKSKADGDAERQRELEEVEHEIEELGGLERYQRMSTIGQGKDRGGGSECVFIGWLNELGVREGLGREKGVEREGGKGKGKERGKLRLLEVGALKPDNYASCSTWIDVLPIDLRSTHPAILEQDFLQMDLENRERWDAISLSLVVNFVPEPRDRGRMLCLAHEMLRENGLLFLALPIPCVSNSRYLTFEHLTQLMSHIGFDVVRERWKAGGKMAYWLFRKVLEIRKTSSGGDTSEGGETRPRFDKKVVLREGKRNNFCILL